MSCDSLFEYVLTLCPDELLYEFTALEEQDRRDAAYPEAGGEFLILVYIALTDDGTTFVFVGELIDEWPYHLAGTAPSSPKVYDDELITSDELVEVLAVDYLCHEFSFPYV